MNPKEIENIIDRSVDWFMGSGMINMDRGDPRTYGSINSYYKPGSGSYAYAYSEITGYGLTFLSFLYSRRADSRFLDAALDSYKWLKEKAMDRDIGGCYCRMELDTGLFKPKRICSFDNGMILDGLCCLHKQVNDDGIFDLSVQVGDYLLEHMIDHSGEVKARYIFEGDRAVIEPDMDKWSSQSGSFLAKIAMGLANLYIITDEQRYLDASISVCRNAMSAQDDSGRFITNRFDGSTHLHPHSYTCEGLLTVGMTIDDREMIGSALRGIGWSIENQNQTGGFPRMLTRDEFVRPERNDINAQVTRLALMGMEHGLEVDEEVIQKAVERMIFFHRSSENKREDGCFVYGFNDDGAPMNNPNSWVTMFNVQTLFLYLDHLKGDLDLDPLMLV